MIVAACVTVPSPTDRLTLATRVSDAHGWDEIVIPAGDFDLAAWVPRRIVAMPKLTIYIEGDGFAWTSSDPTPVSPTGLHLALAQPEGNIAYLARPCQYVRCEQRYWTSHRFAPEVIASANLALEALKKKFGAQCLVLVGYSGGGAVAALLAEQRLDVVRLITIAGNLDHRAWTSHHRVSA